MASNGKASKTLGLRELVVSELRKAAKKDPDMLSRAVQSAIKTIDWSGLMRTAIKDYIDEAVAAYIEEATRQD